MSDARTMTYQRALAMGVTEWEIRTGRWEHPYWGCVRQTGSNSDDPDVRIGDAITLMTPSDLLTGWAAARGHGVKYADGRDSWFRPIPLTMISTDGGQHRQRDGLRPSRRTVHDHEITQIGAVAVATLTRSAYDLALDAPNLCEAVVAIEMCISTVIEQGRTTRSSLKQLMDQHTKTRGIAQARQALKLSSSRSASPWESRTRFVATVGGGLGSLEVNVPIFDRQGRLAGIADLLDRAAGFVIESDGAGHRQELAHAGDNIREEAFEMLNLFVSRVGSIDHRDEQQLIGRLQSARLHALTRQAVPLWTTEKPAWWSTWPLGRRWD